MIVIFGAIAMDEHFGVPSLPGDCETVEAHYYQDEPGGKAIKQAIAAVRSEAKVHVYGQIGRDENANFILNTLETEGINAEGINRGDAPTGLSCYIQDNDDRHHTVFIPGANAELKSDSVPDDVLEFNTVLLLQTEIDAEENYKLLKRAKAAESQTIMNLAPSIEMSQKALNLIDYLIVNQDEARLLAKKMGLDVEDNALKIAQGLAQLGKLNCIITIGARGGVAVTSDNKGWSVEALDVEEIVDRSGAEDAYCGTFAACIDAGLHLPRAMKRASVAGSLACTRRGLQSSFPTFEEIEARINDLEDPKSEDLEEL